MSDAGGIRTGDGCTRGDDPAAPRNRAEPADADGPGRVLQSAASAALASTFWSERGLRDLALLSLTVLSLLLCFLIVRPFVSALAWAAALAVIAWPLHRRLVGLTGRPTASATLSVIVVTLLLILPIGVIVPAVIDEALAGYKLIRARIETDAWSQALGGQAWMASLWEWLRERIDVVDLLQRAGTALTAIGSYAVRVSFTGSIEFALTLFFLFYFLRDATAVLEALRRLLPVSRDEGERLLRVAHDTLFATVFGKALVAIVQGTLGGAMFWWLDLPAYWLWGVVMALLSLIPLLGPPLVWLPAALLLLAAGEWAQALLVVAWGAAIVGLADNLLYPVVVGRYLRLHTVPLLVALIGGLAVFGAVGFFLGPVVLALTAALLGIWRDRVSAAESG